MIPGTLVPTVDLVIPPDFEQIGGMLSLGDSIRDTYTGRLRFFGSVGVNYNRVLDVGGSGEGGIATSLFGHDRLSFSGSYSQGGFGANATTTKLSLHYQSWF